MRKLIVIGFAAALTFAAVGTWATTTTSRDHVKASAAVFSPVNPLELMKAAPSNLPHEQHDAF